MTLDEFVREVWEPGSGRLRECTRAGYASAYRLHIAPALGGMGLGEVTPAVLDGWLAGFASAGAARKSWALLRSILRLAVRRGYLEADPTIRVERVPGRGYYEPQVLSAGQARAVLRGFYGHELEAWVICSLCAGLRRCESVGLEWADIDLRAGTITVRRSVQWVDGHETVTPPKTPQSRRTVALPRFAVQRLRQLKRGKTGRIVGELNANQVARRYASWCKRQRLPYVPPRNLRHSWGTIAVASGVDISLIARQLGHADISTTARYYLKPDVQVLHKAQSMWSKAITG